MSLHLPNFTQQIKKKKKKKKQSQDETQDLAETQF